MRTYTGPHAARGTVGPPDDAGRGTTEARPAYAGDRPRDPGRRHRRHGRLRARSQRLGQCRLHPRGHAEHDGRGLSARVRGSGEAHVHWPAQSPRKRSVRARGAYRVPASGLPGAGELGRLTPGLGSRQWPHDGGCRRAIPVRRRGQADVVEARQQVAPHSLVGLTDPDEPQAPYARVLMHAMKLCRHATRVTMDAGPKSCESAPTHWPRMRQRLGPSVEPAARGFGQAAMEPASRGRLECPP